MSCALLVAPEDTQINMVTKNDLATAMNARIVGSGKSTLILAHGYGTDQSIWDNILPYLAERCKVLVFDWCFSGAVKDHSLYDATRHSSYDAFADDLICVLDELNLKSSIFVGHSMSGMIGCVASIKRPDLFNRLVLVGASPRYISNHAQKQVSLPSLCEGGHTITESSLVNLEAYEGGFDMSEIDELLSNIEKNYDQWTSIFASLAVDSSDPISIQKFEKCLKNMNPEVALPMAKTVFLSDYRHILDKVVTHSNIIQTRKDIIVPDSVLDFMQSKIKGKCEVDIIDTEGHFPQLTVPIKFVEVLDRIILGC